MSRGRQKGIKPWHAGWHGTNTVAAAGCHCVACDDLGCPDHPDMSNTQQYVGHVMLAEPFSLFGQLLPSNTPAQPARLGCGNLHFRLKYGVQGSPL